MYLRDQQADTDDVTESACQRDSEADTDSENGAGASPVHLLFLTRITLFKYRLQLTGFELPADVLASQLEFDRR